MKTINFYKLFAEENLLPSITLICNKILETEEKVVIFLETPEEVQALDDKLWTFSQTEFIPHMSELSEEFEEMKEEVPILLSSNLENVIEAENLLILKKLTTIEGFEKFKKIFFLFDGEKQEPLQQARDFWKQISSLKTEFNAKFYEQSAEKKWSLKA